MECPKCKNNGSMKEDFEVLDYESSKSNWDDYDQIIELKCKKCGYKFTHID